MAYADELENLINELFAGRREKEEAERVFDAAWKRLRDGELARVLGEAAAVMDRHPEIKGMIKRPNGGICLESGTLTLAEAILCFEPDHEKREIICTLKDQPKETYTVEHLTVAVIRGKVEDLLRVVLES